MDLRGEMFLNVARVNRAILLVREGLNESLNVSVIICLTKNTGFSGLFAVASLSGNAN